MSFVLCDKVECMHHDGDGCMLEDVRLASMPYGAFCLDYESSCSVGSYEMAREIELIKRLVADLRNLVRDFSGSDCHEGSRDCKQCAHFDGDVCQLDVRASRLGA